MPTLFDFVPMLFSQQTHSQQLKRRPEPTELTEGEGAVADYNQVMATKLVEAYIAGLETVHRAQETIDAGNAIDLACGPGHYSLCLAKYLGYDEVLGVDLSAPMIETASANADEVVENVRFEVGDVTELHGVPNDHFALSSFTDAAHHMPDLELVTRILRKMDQITRPDGLVMVMDLVRLRTEAVTERYVRTLGHDYIDRGLSDFFDDFRNSMYAAWTADELRSAIPRDTRRTWCHIVPRGLPTIQFVLGLPVGRTTPFIRPGFGSNHPLVTDWYPRWQQQVGTKWARETLTEWKMLKMSLRFGSTTLIPPAP